MNKLIFYNKSTDKMNITLKMWLLIVGKYFI